MLQELGMKGITQPHEIYLNSAVSSTVIDLDATIVASYPGSGAVWANLTPAPADGSVKSAYDFYRGDAVTGGTFPAFTGVAGNPAAYWSLDGGDYFALKSGSNTAFFNALHKTTGGSDWWAAFAFQYADNGTAYKFYGTSTGAGGNIGIAEQITSGDLYRSQQRGAASGPTADATGALSNGTNYLIIVSHSHSTNTTRIWKNSATAQSVSHTYGTTIAAASNTMKIGANGVAAQNVPGGTRIYSFAMGNAYLDNAKAAAIIAHLNTRHGRVYA